MSTYTRMGTIAATAIVSREPDRSGNFVADGTADDVEIQAAIDYVGTLGGGDVTILTGTYTLSAPLDVYPNLTLEGGGEDTVLILADNANCSIIRYAGSPTPLDFFRMFRLKLDGNRATMGGVAALVDLEIPRECRIFDCFITEGIGNAVYLHGVGDDFGWENHVFRNAISDNNGWGLYSESCDENHYEHNSFHHDLVGGIRCRGEDIVAHNTFTNCCGADIGNFAIEVGNWGPTVIGNSISPSLAGGIHHVGGVDPYNAVINDNVIGPCAATAIHVGAALYITIVGNSIYRASYGNNYVYDAIWLQGVTGGTVSGNTIVDDQVPVDNSNGIRLDSSVEIVVSSNYIEGAWNGIRLAGADNSVVSENFIKRCTNGIEVAAADDAILANNRITLCTDSIAANFADAVRMMIMGNNWEGCTNNPAIGAAVNPRITSNIDINGAWWITGDNPA